MTLKISDDTKVEAALLQIHKVLNNAGLNIPELILVYGNLGYQLGAAIAGYRSGELGPSIETLQLLHATHPTVDVNFMLQGLLITEWEQDYISHPVLSSLAKTKTSSKPIKGE